MRGGPPGLAVMQVVEQFLGPFQGEGRDDDVAATPHGGVDGVVELLDGGLQLFVPAIAVSAFHDHHVDGWRRCRIAQDRPGAQAQVAGKEYAPLFVPFVELQHDAGRAENVPGVDEGGLDPRCQWYGLAVARHPTEALQGVESIEEGIERLYLSIRLAAFPGAAVPIAGLFLLQSGCVEHDQSGQFAAGGGGDDLSAKAAIDQQRNAPAMVEVGMGQQQVVDACRVEPEVIGIVFFELAAPLVEAAVHQNAGSGAFEQMAGAGHVPGGTVEG